MTSEQQKLVIEYMLGRLSYDELVQRTGLDPAGQPDFATTVLHDSFVAQDADSVECALLLIFHFELVKPGLAPLLARLLLQPWHRKHEDIASALQQLRVPATADALAEAALVKHDYLAYNDSHALARKCTWALADIGSPQARCHLETLARVDDAEIAGYAQKRLDSWDSELGRKGAVRATNGKGRR
jgi:hypothetical protein